MTRIALILCASLSTLAACSIPSSEPSFDSTNPADRTRAIAGAARNPDPQHLRGLIAELDSTDPAQRMFAIRTLQRLTGQTLGYRHSAPEAERAEAVERWVDWYQARSTDQDQTNPPSQTAG